MTLKYSLTALLYGILLFTQKAEAQNYPGGEQAGHSITVTGKLEDTLSKEPIAFASLLLKNSATGEDHEVNADSTGRFIFPGIVPGRYHLSAFYVGYPKLEQDFTVDSSGKDMALGNLYLHGEANALREVKVVDYKTLIEQRPDGIVYNADKDGTNKGTTAADLLRKVPMLTVDLDGNVQMRGNSNIKVLIDGKPSTIIAASVKDALKQIPSDNIKSVEVITSPGAKYDAEGAAGVINIITRKNIIKGISGMFFSGLSYNTAQNTLNGFAGANLNYRTRKFGLSANLGGGRWTSQSEADATRVNNPGTADESVLTQKTKTNSSGPFLWGKISADYTIDSLNTVTAGFGFHPGNWKSHINQSTSFPEYHMNYDQETRLATPRSNYSFDASYSKKFRKNPQQTLDILSLYTIDGNTSNYTLVQTNNDSHTQNYKERNNNNARNGEFTLQADYVQPFRRNKQKLEAGLKYIDRNVSSNYALYTWQAATGGDFVLDPSRTNWLSYNQQVGAAYGQFSSNLTRQLSAIAGIRYEYTDITGQLRDNGGTFKSSYSNIMPSAILSYDLKHFNKLKLSYNQRIERPSIDYINPFINSSDPLNISYGNPRLAPELTHNIELGYSTLFRSTSINVSAFYSRTNNAIEALSTIGSDGVNRTTFGNFAHNNTLGANFFGSTTLFGKWMINLNGNLYHKELKSASLDIRNDGWQYDAHVYSSVQVAKGLSIEGFGMYQGTQIMLQGTQSGWYYYMLGLKKSVLKGKGDISLVAENFFSPDIKIVSDFNYGNATYHMTNYTRARGIRAGFTYNFGKMHFAAPEKKVNNNDLKQGAQNQQQGTQMGM